jgi:hypothetical protein
MRTISINQISFFDAFERDVDFYDSYRQAAYLDLKTGGVIWIFEEDQDADTAAAIDPAGESKTTRENRPLTCEIFRGTWPQPRGTS